MMTMCKLHLIWRVILNLCTHPILLATSSRSESSPNPILYSDRGRPSKTLPVMFQLKSRVCLDRLHRGLIISISRAQLIVELVCANLRNCLVRWATKLFSAIGSLECGIFFKSENSSILLLLENMKRPLRSEFTYTVV